MRNKWCFVIALMIFILCQSCIKSNKKSNSLLDFEMKWNKSCYLENDTLKKFVEDFIDLPINSKRKVFTLYIDQRLDTLLFTIWRYPRRSIDLNNAIGYFYCRGKVIVIYSPFNKFLKIEVDKADKQKISQLYNSEVEYYKIHKQELVMWQLQIPYHGDSFVIQKDFNCIFNTTKAPNPSGFKENIEYQAK